MVDGTTGRTELTQANAQLQRSLLPAPVVTVLGYNFDYVITVYLAFQICFFLHALFMRMRRKPLIRPLQSVVNLT